MDAGTDRPHDVSIPECMSCHVGDDCQYVSARFSTSGLYYVESCLGPGIPRHTLRHAHGDASPGNHSNRFINSAAAEFAFRLETRSQAVARIADRTASQHLRGSREFIGHVSI